MCGSFALSAKTKNVEKLVKGLKIENDIQTNNKFVPGNYIPSVLNVDSSVLVYSKWGLIPSWSKDSKSALKMFNARAETLNEKPSFRNLIKKRRCLIFADGFYEWQANPNSKYKTAYFFRLQSGEPFTFAGLWDLWNDIQLNTKVLSSTIITTMPTEQVAEIHDRMPLIIPEELREKWLSADEFDSNDIELLTKPFTKEEFVISKIERA